MQYGIFIAMYNSMYVQGAYVHWKVHVNKYGRMDFKI